MRITAPKAKARGHQTRVQGRQEDGRRGTERKTGGGEEERGLRGEGQREKGGVGLELLGEFGYLC
jgi:hypothetical protein